MTHATEGALLWTPSAADIENANLTAYMRWLADRKGLRFATYQDLWRWSVTEIEAFWETIWEYFDLTYSGAWSTALDSRTMPGARWFPGVSLNYAENIFGRSTPDRPMLLYKTEDAPLVAISWQEMAEQTARLAHALRQMGVRQGDRVVAFMPNIPETIVAMLATASLGAIWSSCSPDFGSRSVLDRFVQIEPTVLIAVDGYQYGGKQFDRRGVVRELQAALPSLEQTILVPYSAETTADLHNTHLWRDVLADAGDRALTFAQVPFDHPLWVLYSSGTTGLPKPIVHGHGGVLLEHVRATAFHNDQRPGDRFFWYTSTGWMMWNYMLGTLLAGSTIIVYNGSPAYPDLYALFELAEASGMTYFGTSAAFVSACMKAGIRPNQHHDLSAIRGVGSTGSPLTPEGFRWIYDNLNAHLALESLSGGTDLCTAFVGGARVLPIYTGEIQCATLGSKVEAYDDTGSPVIDEVGELVITEPLPSMPLYFWNDPDQSRYRASYFEMFPGIWRHGDWIKINDRGGCIIYGRSDSTINRQGIRMGTSELYRVVEAFDEVVDSLIIDLEFRGRDSYLPLFVVLRQGAVLDDDLRNRIRRRLRSDVSPRHVPDDIFQLDAIPYTLSGKKMEVPVRKIMLGVDPSTAVKRGAMRNPESLAFFEAFAREMKAEGEGRKDEGA